MNRQTDRHLTTVIPFLLSLAATYPQIVSADSECEVMLTHSLDQSIIPANSIACAFLPEGITAENSFYRSFDLIWFGIIGAFDVTSVDIGIEVVQFNDYPFEINLYDDLDGGEPHLADLVLLGSASAVALQDSAPLIMNIPVTGQVPASGTVVVEFHYPDGQELDPPAGMWPGSNGFGQTGPSYIRADDCGIYEPTDLSDIFTPIHLVMNVYGVSAKCACSWDLDGDANVGILDLLALLAAWGTDPGGPPDFDGDGTVGILDLLTLLANWGPCP